MSDSIVVQTAFLGDLLLGIPLFKKLKARDPQGRLVVVCRAGLGSFLLDAGLVDEVVEIDKRKSAESYPAALKKLEGRTFDFLFCPHESTRSALFSRKIRASKKIAFRSWFNGIFFDERVSRPMQDPEVIRQFKLLAPVDPEVDAMISTFEGSQRKPGGRFDDGSLVPVPPGATMIVPKLSALRDEFKKKGAWRGFLSGNLKNLVDEFSLGTKPIAVLAPGSVWATKMWTKEGFIETGRSLATKGFRVLISGSKDEAELCEEIASQIQGASSLAGRTSLFESAQILAISEILVCNDSGAMHLAACAGTRTVSIFGPTVLDFGYRPWNDRASVVEIDLACRPCGTHGARTCPLGTHACMRNVGAQAVIESVDRVLKR